MSINVRSSGSTPNAKAGRLYGGVSSEARRDERRQAFVDAGIEVFGRDGYAGATTRQLCAAAGLTQRYFYESFRNTEDLFAAVSNRLGAELEAEIRSAVQGPQRPAPEAVRASLQAFFGYMLKNRKAARILLIETLTVGPRTIRAVRKFTATQAEYLRELVEQLHPDIKQTSSNVRLIASGLVGAAYNIAIQWMSEGYKESLDEVVDSAMWIYGSLLPR